MTTCNIAAIAGWIAVLGTFAASWVSVANTRRGIAKENANRRVALEQYAEEIFRYHRHLRLYLLDLEKQGIIDIKRVDMAQFPLPPKPPMYNGDT